jgi:hypothetical protein
MRRIRLPAALTVTVIGVVAPLAAGISACSGNDGPHPDASIGVHADAHVAHGDAAPGDGGGSADGGVVQDAGVDAAVPLDAPPDTPIT